MLDWMGICWTGLGMSVMTGGTASGTMPYIAYFRQISMALTLCGMAG